MSIYGLIKRIEARASDGRFYALEDQDREKAIAHLKRYAKTFAPDLPLTERRTVCPSEGK